MVKGTKQQNISLRKKTVNGKWPETNQGKKLLFFLAKGDGSWINMDWKNMHKGAKIFKNKLKV